ncbi:glycosyltransferase family 2 protein [Nitrincola schmidtii]|uniref:glycosyltransferase family 2 protein n=1 Tax=Nitrincola schmidtii TaxID=1730894 RepID=UPI00124C294E|nr:glycosyltransferase family 2 protein [Nitrincola schmidtii]
MTFKTVSDPQLISVIIPIYNSERYLRDCLISVQQQTYKDIEIICVNDGSTDGSAAILDEFAEQDIRVRVVHQENRGITKAREQGVTCSSGSYIYFLDSDDLIHQETLEKLHQIAVKEKADIVGHKHLNVAKDASLSLTIQALKPAKVIQPSAAKGILNKKISIFSWGKLYQRSLFDGFDFPMITFAEDLYCTPILSMKANKICILQQKLCFYRQHVASLTGNFNEAKLNSIFDQGIRMVKELTEAGYDEKSIKMIRKYVCYYQLYSIARLLLKKPELANLYSVFSERWKTVSAAKSAP